MKKITTLLLAFVFMLSVSGQTVSTVTEGIFEDGLSVNSQGVVYGSNFTGSNVYAYDDASGTVSVFADGFVRPNGLDIGLMRVLLSRKRPHSNSHFQ